MDSIPPVTIKLDNSNHTPHQHTKINQGIKKLQLEIFPLKCLSESLKWDIYKIASSGKGFLLPSKVLERVLKDHIVNKAMTFGDETWSELSSLIDKCDSYTLNLCAVSLYYSSKKSHDTLSGYSLIVLFCLVLKTPLTLPEISQCDFYIVEKFLRLILSSFQISSKAAPNTVIEFLLLTPHKKKKLIFLPYIEPKCLIDYVTTALIDLPFEKWGRKETIIINLFSSIDKTCQLKASKILMKAQCDEKTQSIGRFFGKILLSDTSYSAFTYMQRIQTLLPSLENDDFYRIFKLPFPSFRCQDQIENGYQLIRLGFTEGQRIIVHEPLMIGTYISSDGSQWLFAYNFHMHLISWGQPIEGKVIDFCKTSEILTALVRSNQHEILIIDQLSGHLKSRIALSLPKEIKIDSYFVNQQGFCFLIAFVSGEKYLYVGRLSKTKWKFSFRVKFPYLHFTPLGDFIAYKDSSSSTIYVMNQKGKVTVLDNCIDILHRNNKLYIVKKVRSQYFISEHNMPNGSHFNLQSSIKQISLYGLSLKLIDVLADGTCICIQHNKSKSRLYFVDIEKKRILPSKNKKPIGGQLLVNKTHQCIFSCDTTSKTIQKITRSECEEISPLEGILVHADNDQNLFYINH